MAQQTAVREAECEFEVDHAADAGEAEAARQALERVLSTSAADIDTDLLQDLARLEVYVSYPRPTFTDGAYTRYEPVTLGDTSRIEMLTLEELIRRGVPSESID